MNSETTIILIVSQFPQDFISPDTHTPNVTTRCGTNICHAIINAAALSSPWVLAFAMVTKCEWKSKGDLYSHVENTFNLFALSWEIEPLKMRNR